ncbi:MAG TPA: hypothetical protein VMF11_11740 [Candidatus Baltobacteraceae bacterium]|nr:hypothetical protein [Candidatus Baltobacteraceae bacterium]
MRRIVAFVLMLVFVLQSTASAASTNTSRFEPSLQDQLAMLMQPVVEVIAGSEIYALLTGGDARYQEMHAPRPQIARIHPDNYRPNVNRARFARATVRYGEPGRPPVMPDDVP